MKSLSCEKLAPLLPTHNSIQRIHFTQNNVYTHDNTTYNLVVVRVAVGVMENRWGVRC